MLDCRDDKNKEKIQSVLRKIKNFSEYDKVPIEMLEKFVFAACKKYEICVQYMMFPNHARGRIYYSCSVKREDTEEWVGSVNAVEVYEVFAKVAILIYAVVKKGEIPKR